MFTQGSLIQSNNTPLFTSFLVNIYKETDVWKMPTTVLFCVLGWKSQTQSHADTLSILFQMSAEFFGHTIVGVLTHNEIYIIFKKIL